MIDRDLTSGVGAWGTNADGTLETRLYFAQNWRADTSVVLSASGAILRASKYTAYGKRVDIDTGDFNRDGFVDFNDYDSFMTCYEDATCPGTRTADVDCNGFADFFDYDAFVEAYDNDKETDHGGLRTLYAGYERDPGLETQHPDGTLNDVYHVRHRVYSTDLGRWIRRDPLGYVDIGTLVEYVGDNPVAWTDPNGQQRRSPSDGDFMPYPGTTQPPVRFDLQAKRAVLCAAQLQQCQTAAYNRYLRETRHWDFLDHAFSGYSAALSRLEQRRRDCKLQYEACLSPKRYRPMRGFSLVAHCFFCFQDGSTIGWGPADPSRGITEGLQIDNPSDKEYCTPYTAIVAQDDACIKREIMRLCNMNTGTYKGCRFDPNRGYDWKSNNCYGGCDCMDEAFKICERGVSPQTGGQQCNASH